MIEFWTVENTGWSGGVSWFHTGGTIYDPMRFSTQESAIAYAAQQKIGIHNILWRVVHTTIERSDNKEVTTRTWNNI